MIHRVPPVYPLQAKSLRMEGKVVLDATVMEDGSVRDLKVVEGPAVFTASAMEAVKKWRYKPFVLDGKAVKSPMRIMVDFKLPSTLVGSSVVGRHVRDVEATLARRATDDERLGTTLLHSHGEWFAVCV